MFSALECLKMHQIIVNHFIYDQFFKIIYTEGDTIDNIKYFCFDVAIACYISIQFQVEN